MIDVNCHCSNPGLCFLLLFSLKYSNLRKNPIPPYSWVSSAVIYNFTKDKQGLFKFFGIAE